MNSYARPGLAHLLTLLAALGVSRASQGQAQRFLSVGPIDAVSGYRTIEDVNGDGAPDLIAVGPAGGANTPMNCGLTVSLNDGTGRFLPATYALIPSYLSASYVAFGDPLVADIDGDGDNDIVGALAPNGPGRVAPIPIYLNDGLGGFSPTSADRFGGLTFGSVVFVGTDVDGDGAVDLATIDFDRASSTQLIRVFRNDGTGTFTEAFGVIPTPPFASTLQFADLDADGDEDCVVGTGWGIANVALTNDGAGQFTQTSSFSSLGISLIEIHDFDGDGYLDVLFANSNSTGVPGMEVWMNDRAGGFIYEPARLNFVWPPHTYRHRLDLVDLDGDGDIDIFCAAIPSEEILLNDGTGHFIDGSAVVPLPTGRYLAAVDLDRDGDADLIELNHWTAPTNLSWHANISRNVVTSDPPVGGTLRVDLYGEPGTSATYLLGLARLDVHLPGIGWLGLDPTLSAVWPQAHPLPPSRKVSLTLPVPADPQLRGARLWAQSVHIETGSIRLASVWPITIQ